MLRLVKWLAGKSRPEPRHAKPDSANSEKEALYLERRLGSLSIQKETFF